MHLKSRHLVLVDERESHSDAFKKQVHTWFPPTLHIAYHPFEEESLPNTKDITTSESVKIALESMKKQIKARHMQLTCSYQLKDKLDEKHSTLQWVFPPLILSVSAQAIHSRQGRLC